MFCIFTFKKMKEKMRFVRKMEVWVGETNNKVTRKGRFVVMLYVATIYFSCRPRAVYVRPS